MIRSVGAGLAMVGLVLSACSGMKSPARAQGPAPGASNAPNPASTPNAASARVDYDRPAISVKMPEFPPGLPWFNVKAPLTMESLRGKMVLLDFWTYG